MDLIADYDDDMLRKFFDGTDSKTDNGWEVELNDIAHRLSVFCLVLGFLFFLAYETSDSIDPYIRFIKSKTMKFLHLNFLVFKKI